MNVPLMYKPGSWFLLAKMFEKHPWKSDMQVNDLPLYLKCHSSIGVFQTFWLVKTNYVVCP